MSATTGPRAGDVRPPLWSRIYWALADGLVLAKRNLIQIPRIPELLIFATIQPVMFVLLFRYVFGGAIDVGSQSYVNYLMAGIFAQTVAFGSMTTGIGLAEDLSRGLIDRFRSLPMARSAVLVGRTIADLARNVFVVTVMLVVGLLVGFRPEGDLTGRVAAIGLLVRNVEAVQPASFVWLFPLTFASSAFVPTSSMPGWLRAFADRQPITQVVDSVRGFLLDEPVGSTGWQALAWCLGILVVFVPLAVSLYRRTTAR